MSANLESPIESLKCSAKSFLRRDLEVSETSILESYKRGVIDNSPPPPLDPCSLPPEKKSQSILGGDFLHWLVTKAPTQDLPAVTRIVLFNQKFPEKVDLSCAVIPVPVIFQFCDFEKEIALSDTKSRTLEFRSCNLQSIIADRLRVEGRFLLSPAVLGENDLRLRTVVKSQLRLCGAFISGNFDLRSAKIGNIGGHPVPLFADGLEVCGNLLLINRCVVNGLAKLNGVVIGRNFDCSGARIYASDYTAIAAENAKVEGDVLLRKCPPNFHIYANHVDACFESVGRISFENASIEGKLSCHGACFNHAGLEPKAEQLEPRDPQGPNISDETAQAFCGDRMTVKGSVEFSFGFHVRGEVRLINSEIHDDLMCRDGCFDHAGDLSLTVDGIDVHGTTFMDGTFATTGIVSLIHGTLREGLYLKGAKFQSGGHAPTGFQHSLPIEVPLASAERVGAWFEKGDRGIRGAYLNISGKLDLRNMWSGNSESERERFKVDLFHARTSVLQDNKESWTQRPGHIGLIGFTYEGIDNLVSSSLSWRLALIQKHYARTPFNRQPYLQLGRVLKASGFERQARKLAIEREKDATKFGDYPWAWRQWRRVLWAVIGYGYSTRRVLWWIFAVWLASSLVFHFSYLDDQLVPSKRGVPEIPGANPTNASLTYPDFNPLTFTLDLIVPLVNLRQSEYWIPAEYSSAKIKDCANVSGGYWLWCSVKAAVPGSLAAWFHLVLPFLGWFFTTIFIAGFTGIVKKD